MKDEMGFYFVDRNGRIFEIILDYLRAGRLIVPPGIPFAAVLQEMDFYGIRHEDCVTLGDLLRMKTALGPGALSPAEQSAYDKCWPLIQSTLLAAAELGRSQASGFTHGINLQFNMHSLPGSVSPPGVSITREEHIAWCTGTDNRLWLYIQHRHGVTIGWKGSEIQFSW